MHVLSFDPAIPGQGNTLTLPAACRRPGRTSQAIAGTGVSHETQERGKMNLSALRSIGTHPDGATRRRPGRLNG